MDIGLELKLKRTELKLSLKKVAKALDVSESYLSEIERNKKIPSDDLIHDIAEFYGMDEVYIANQYDKISIAISEELRNNIELHETLFNISTDKKLTDEQKQKLYDDIQKLYKEALHKG